MDRVTPAPGAVASQAYTIIINTLPTLATLAPTAWTVSRPYSGSLTISNGTPAYGNLSVSNAPPGITSFMVSGSTITLSGTPTMTGTFNNVLVRVTDAAGAVANQTYAITINAAPTLGTLSPSQTRVGQVYDGTITISDGIPAYGSLSVSNAPPGITSFMVSGSTITLSGTPTTIGVYNNVVVRVTDAAGALASQTYTLTVTNPVPVLSSLSTTSTVEGSASFTLTLTGTDFVAGAVAQWNGTTLTSFFDNGTQLRATVPASLLGEEGDSEVTVVNPTPGGGLSSSLVFHITDAPLTAVGQQLQASVGDSLTNVLVANFSDANGAAPLADFSARISWLDATGALHASNGIIQRAGHSFQVLAPQTTVFTRPGTYTLTVQVTDVGGSTTQASSKVVVTVPPAPPPNQLGSFVRSQSTAYDAQNQAVTAVVYGNGQLYLFDTAGAHLLGGSVLSASVAFSPQGQEVLDVVFSSNQLYSYDASGAHFIGNSVLSVNLTYDPQGQPIRDVVFTNNLLYSFDATGAHYLGNSVLAASRAFDSLGQQILEVVYTDSTLYQFDSTGSHFLTLSVESVAVTFNRHGQRVLDVIYSFGDVWRY